MGTQPSRSQSQINSTNKDIINSVSNPDISKDVPKASNSRGGTIIPYTNNSSSNDLNMKYMTKSSVEKKVHKQAAGCKTC